MTMLHRSKAALAASLVLAAVAAMPADAAPDGGTSQIQFLCRQEIDPEAGAPVALTLADALDQCTRLLERKDLSEDVLAKAYNNRCWLRTELGDAGERALRDCSIALSYDPDLAAAYLNRGRLWARLGNFDEARKDFARTIELDQTIAAAWNNRGELSLRQKQYQAALDDLDHAIELDPKMAAAYNNRGAVFEAVGAYDKALAEFDKALDLDPTFADAILNRGIIALHRGDYQQAAEAFTRSIRQRDFFGRAFLLRGFAYEAMGRTRLAGTDYRRAHAAGMTGDWLAERLRN